MVDYYSILGLQKSASKEDVKKAYKKLAKQWHPDKNPDNQEEATRKFKEVSEAYQILVDDSKRRAYDREGQGCFKPDTAQRNYSKNQNYNKRNDPAQDDLDDLKTRFQNFSDLGAGSRRSRFRSNRRHTEPDFNNSHFNQSSFMFKDPEEVFKEFFGGLDPFKDFMKMDPLNDFIDPFGSFGSPKLSKIHNLHNSERSIPLLLGFTVNHSFPDMGGFHGFSTGTKSLFEDLEEMDSMFGGLGFAGHHQRFHHQACRPTTRSRSSHPSYHSSRSRPESSFNAANPPRRKRY